MNKKYNPSIQRKTTYMQRIADYVEHGYTLYTSGRVLISRADRLATKFARYYRVDLDRFDRAKNKKLGLGNAVMLWHQPGDSPELYWTLLVSPGEHPATTMEKLKDCKTHPIELTGYELVRLAKSMTETGKHSNAQSRQLGARCSRKIEQRRTGKIVWTWRMTAQKYVGTRELFVDLIRHRSISQFHRELHDLYASPGFHGVRSQVGKIWQLIRAEWLKHIGNSVQLPAKPFLLYARRLSDSAVRLSELTRF